MIVYPKMKNYRTQHFGHEIFANYGIDDSMKDSSLKFCILYFIRSTCMCIAKSNTHTHAS